MYKGTYQGFVRTVTVAMLAGVASVAGAQQSRTQAAKRDSTHTRTSARDSIASTKAEAREQKERGYHGGPPDAHEAAILSADAKISIDSAKKIALARVAHSTIERSWIEREDGKLFYDLKLKVAGKSGLEEVHVSALDGSILEMKHRAAGETRSNMLREHAHDSTAAPKSYKKP